jgi:hypothetical protein
MPLCRDLKELLPDVQERVYSAIKELNSKDIAFVVLETYRDQMVQDAYYAQGREPLDVVNALRLKAEIQPLTEEENRQIITKARYSYHTKRRAIDIVPALSNGNIPWSVRDASTAALWLSLAEVMKANGFEWGGDWDPKNEWGIGWDSSHYQV